PNLSVRRSTIHALIGPNGAGKTSLLNVLSGFYAPQAGTIELNGVSIVGQSPYAIARRGIARTFPTAQVFSGLSVRDNVAVGVAGGPPRALPPPPLGASPPRFPPDAAPAPSQGTARARGLGLARRHAGGRTGRRPSAQARDCPRARHRSAPPDAGRAGRRTVTGGDHHPRSAARRAARPRRAGHHPRRAPH